MSQTTSRVLFSLFTTLNGKYSKLTFAASITWIGEFIVLGLFNSYAYKTGLFTNVWADNLFGHLLLNTTLYPAIAIVIAANSLRYGGIILVTALLALIEYLFIKLGAYEHH